MNKGEILSFFIVAEAIAGVITLIPFVIILMQQSQDSTNMGYVIDFFELLPWFLIGEIIGIFISIVIHGFGHRSLFMF